MVGEGEWVWERGGARINHIYLTWPFAVLSLSSSALELRVLFWKWNIPSDDITALSRVSGITTTGIEIGHTAHSVPANPVFWTMNYARLKSALEAAGYEVTET